MLEVVLDVGRMPEPPTVGMSNSSRELDALRSWGADFMRNIDALCSEATELHDSIRMIQQSTIVALANIQLHAANIKSAADTLTSVAHKDFAWMQELLAHYASDLEILQRVPVHPQLFTSMAKNCETGDNSTQFRMLSDLFDTAQVRSAASACEHTLSRLQAAYTQAMKTETHLLHDLHELTKEIELTDLKPSNDAYCMMINMRDKLHANYDLFVAELQLDSRAPSAWIAIHTRAEALYEQEASVVQTLDCLAQDRNELQHRHMNLVQDISSLQSDFSELGTLVAETDTSLEGAMRDEFQTLTQVHTMYGLYGAVLAEAVRRSAFTQMYMAKAQAIAELMAKVSEKETMRRKKLGHALEAALPCHAAGMESTIPALDITTRRRESVAPAVFTQQDLTEFKQHLHILSDELRANGLRDTLEVDVLACMQRFDSDTHDAEADFLALARRELGIHCMDASDSSSSSSSQSDEESHNERSNAKTYDM